MIQISDDEASKLITLDIAFDAVRNALIAAADGTGTVNPVVIGTGPRHGESYSVKSGVAASEGIVGLKVGSYWPKNDELGLPRHSSAVVILDAATGRLRAILEANRLNGFRTAAANAVATSVLAREDASVLSVIGAGHQAWFEVMALCAVRPIEQVLIASRSVERAEALMDQLTDLPARAIVADIETACRNADVLVTVTPSRAPLFDALWVRPGTHIASMGSDQSGKQELPISLMHRASLFADYPQQSIMIGEYQHIRAEVENKHIRITAIGDVLRRVSPGRTSVDQLTIFDSSGLALQDLFVASRILELFLSNGGSANGSASLGANGT